MKSIKKTIISLLTIGVLCGGFLFSALSPTISAAGCNSRLLGFPAWYDGLTEGDDCKIKSPGDNLSQFIWRIVLNVIEMGLVAISYIALFFILYSGFIFISNNGNPEKIVKAKNMILNAVIGLIISIASIGAVNFVMGVMK